MRNIDEDTIVKNVKRWNDPVEDDSDIIDMLYEDAAADTDQDIGEMVDIDDEEEGDVDCEEETDIHFAEFIDGHPSD